MIKKIPAPLDKDKRRGAGSATWRTLERKPGYRISTLLVFPISVVTGSYGRGALIV